MENIKISYKNNKLKMSAATWHDKLELTGKSYPVSDIRYYSNYIFQFYISEKQGERTDKASIRIYVNKIAFNI